jgi:hypothetical protein
MDEQNPLEALHAEWRDAVRGMTFFGIPVEELPADRLLLLIGHFVVQTRMMSEELRRREASAIRVPAGGGFPLIDCD